MTHPLLSQIDEKVKNNPVVIFMKGTPQFPQCGFSARAVQVLRMAGIENPAAVDVLADDPLWDALEVYTKWPTVPQVFIQGKFIGGCDIVTEMYERGELQTLLKDAS
jgi:monothiol glutaredoxin